jgi:hypothetical protein
MNKSIVASVRFGELLAEFVSVIKVQADQAGDSARPDTWFPPKFPVAVELIDRDGNRALALVEGVRAARGGPYSAGAGSTLLVRVIDGKCRYAGAEVHQGAMFAMHSKDTAAIDAVVFSLQETIARCLRVAGIANVDLSDPNIAPSALLGLEPPKPKPESKPRPTRAARVVVADNRAASTKFAGRETDLSFAPALDALEERITRDGE